MDFRQIAMIQKLKSDLNLFRANHPEISDVPESGIAGCYRGRFDHRDQHHYARR